VEAGDDDAHLAKINCYIGELLIVQGASDTALERARVGLACAECR
jgi:hypothetical protein